MGDSGYNYGYQTSTRQPRTVDHPRGLRDTPPRRGWSATGWARRARTTWRVRPAATWDGLNPEMQAQVIMHWYVRKVLEGQTDAEVAPWQPYVDLVRAA